MSIHCFYLEETDKLRRYLRRFHEDCPAAWRFLNGMTPLDIGAWPANTLISVEAKRADIPDDDPRWPVRCDCGRALTSADHSDIFVDRIYRRTDTGEEMVLRDAPVGAMWNAWWMSEHWHGPDGRCLVVKCPPDGREWMIDGRASNCTLPDDNVHKCWVRHGVPPNITVDKDGVTCSAGAGSIALPNWHGFLREGCLVP